MAAVGVRVALLLGLLLDRPGSALQAAATERCSCYRCNSRRQGITGQISSKLASIVTAVQLQTGSAVKTPPLVAGDGTVFVSTEGGALLAYERRAMPATGDMWNPR
jgi:hypothetical protein